MASATRLPKVSKISRAKTVAFARKQRATGDPGGSDGGDGEEGDGDDDGDAQAVANGTPGAENPPPLAAASRAPTAAAPDPEPRPARATIPTMPPPIAMPPAPAVTSATPPVPGPAAPEKSSDPNRARSATVAMPEQASIGAPPAMPADAPPVAAPPVAAPPITASDASAVESPTQMPGPREVPVGNPEDPAAPPGLVPRGDSRSMRRRAERYEFALIYRRQTFVITRFGTVGTRGQWRVVEYPTSASAAHSYAKEVSRFVSEGFSDYRE
jgi:hypothetical protein